MDQTNPLIQQRLTKLENLKELGIDPFKGHFTPSETCKQARDQYEEGRQVSLCGRMTAHREMGKSRFFDLKDQSDRIQIYAKKNLIGDQAWQILDLLDLGDFMGIKGPLFTTKTGEISVKMEELTLLGKAIRPMPEKWHGLADTETRYRQRYLDLMANPQVKETFINRSRILKEIRTFLDKRGFMEVETPMMQPIPGGAAAQPFVTHYNALNSDFFLRIALELNLKRLLVGGLDRVFELGRNFRNEGLSRRHNPEFTMLEVYQAYGDYRSMMELTQSLICEVAQNVLGTLTIEHKDAEGNAIRTIELDGEWKEIRYKDLVREKGGTDWFDLSAEERISRAESLGVDLGEKFEDFEVSNALFEKLIEPTLIQPTFVTHHHKELIPLAKISKEDSSCV